MIRLRFLTALAIAGAVSLTASAQGLSGEASVKYATPLHFDVSAGVDYRTTDGFKDTDQWSVDAGLSGKIIKGLKWGVGYNFIQDHYPSSISKGGYNVSAYWVTKHRAYAGLTGSLKLGKKFTLSLRERYQYTYRNPLDVPRFDDGVPAGNKHVDAKSKHVLRSRLELSFKPYKKCRFEPYVSYEVYSLLKSVNHTDKTSTGGTFADKRKATAGCSYKIDKHNSIELFYRYVYTSDPDDRDASHLIGVGYSLKF